MPVTSLAQRPGTSVDMMQQHTAASGVRRDELLVSSSHGTASRLSPRRTNEECVVDIPDASDAMLCPVPSEFGMVSFDIERIWGGFGTGPWLTEQLGMKLYRAGTDELVLSAKRRGADYLISTFADNPRNANHFAVLRSNVTRTEFRLLGLPRGAEKAHEKGAKGKAAWNGYSNGVPPVELAAITYERNLRGDCPRKLTVVTRGFDEKGRRVHTPTPTSSSDASGLLEALRAGRWQGLNTFATKAPRWNPVQGRYEGSFTDRVKQASVRNFQLVLLPGSTSCIRNLHKSIALSRRQSLRVPKTVPGKPPGTLFRAGPREGPPASGAQRCFPGLQTSTGFCKTTTATALALAWCARAV